MNRENFIYLLIKTLTWPFRYLPGTALHFLGRLLGRIAFYCMRDYRKRTLSNLALAPVQLGSSFSRRHKPHEWDCHWQIH